MLACRPPRLPAQVRCLHFGRDGASPHVDAAASPPSQASRSCSIHDIFASGAASPQLRNPPSALMILRKGLPTMVPIARICCFYSGGIRKIGLPDICRVAPKKNARDAQCMRGELLRNGSLLFALACRISFAPLVNFAIAAVWRSSQNSFTAPSVPAPAGTFEGA